MNTNANSSANVENGCDNLFDPYDLLGQGVKNSKSSALRDSKNENKAENATPTNRDDFL